jgi:hypothetical protein
MTDSPAAKPARARVACVEAVPAIGGRVEAEQRAGLCAGATVVMLTSSLHSLDVIIVMLTSS